MTSTTDTAEHPEIVEISDLTEGLLSPSRTEEVQEHLHGCELCADVHASLEEIRGTLGTLPGPAHMPADIAGRIDAALAAEALLETKAPAEAEYEDKDEAEAQTQSASPVSRETTPADSPTAPADRPSGHPRAATGPGRGGRTRTRRRRGAALGAVFTAAAIGLGVLFLQNGGGTPTGAPESGTPRQSSSALSFSENKLESQVQKLLTEKSSAPSDSSTSKPSLDIQQSEPKTPGRTPRCEGRPSWCRTAYSGEPAVRPLPSPSSGETTRAPPPTSSCCPTSRILPRSRPTSSTRPV